MRAAPIVKHKALFLLFLIQALLFPVTHTVYARVGLALTTDLRALFERGHINTSLIWLLPMIHLYCSTSTNLEYLNHTHSCPLENIQTRTRKPRNNQILTAIK